jgi:Subtilisin-like serine proteases
MKYTKKTSRIIALFIATCILFETTSMLFYASMIVEDKTETLEVEEVEATLEELETEELTEIENESDGVIVEDEESETSITPETTDVIVETSDLNEEENEEESIDGDEEKITAEEEQLLALFPKNGPQLMNETISSEIDFSQLEDERFIVILEEEIENKSELAKEIFSTSIGRVVAINLNMIVVAKEDLAISDEDFIAQLENHQGVKLVEKSVEEAAESQFTPNDPGFSSQRAFNLLKMQSVWEYGTGAGVKIGVYDTGLGQVYSATNEFDQSRILPLVNYAPGGSTSCYNTGNHGTDIVSIIGGAKTNNGIGIASIAHNAIIQPYMSAYECNPAGTSYYIESVDIVKVYEHAIATGVDAMNTSFGTSYPSQVRQNAITRAKNLGVVTIAARGNGEGSTTAMYPACDNDVIALGAVDFNNNIASFSSRGDCGKNNLFVTYGQNIRIYNSSGIGLASGTSFSAPIFAGLFAVIKSAVPSNVTNDQIINEIRISAVDLGTVGYDQIYGHGNINPLSVIQKLTNNKIEIENIIYYLNDDMTIKYAEEINLKTNQKIAIYTYFPNTKIGTQSSHVKYKHILASNDELMNYSDEFNNNGKKIAVYTYFPNTKIGTQSSHVKYKHVLASSDGLMNYSDEFNNNGKKIAVYTYFSNTKVGAQSSHVKYKHVLANNDGLMNYSDEFNNNGKKIAVYTYFPNTKIGTQSSHVKYKHVLASNDGLMNYSDEFNNNGKKIAVYTYFPNTRIGTQSSHVKYKHVLASNDGLMNYSDEFNNNGKKIAVYTYFPNTRIGTQSNHVKYYYVLEVGGSGIIEYVREYNENRIYVAKIYYAENTLIGQHHGKKINRVIVL